MTSDGAQNYYQVLGVTRSAGPDEIRTAYHHLVQEYHPDLHPGLAEAEDRLKEINQAYTVLIDDVERQAYDARTYPTVPDSVLSDTPQPASTMPPGGVHLRVDIGSRRMSVHLDERHIWDGLRRWLWRMARERD